GCLSRPIGAGPPAASAVPGTRRRGSIASRSSAIGTAWSPLYRRTCRRRCDAGRTSASGRDLVRLADRDGEQVHPVGAAHMDGSARVLLAVADLHVEGEDLRRLQRLLRLGEGPALEIEFHATLAHDVEEGLFHGQRSRGWRPRLDRYGITLT